MKRIFKKSHRSRLPQPNTWWFFATLSLAKISWLHLVIGVQPLLFIPVTLFNGATLFLLYRWITVRGKKVSTTRLLVLQLVITVLVIADLMYYSHFYTLLPAHSILQVGQLGPVTGSIVALFRPTYLIMTIDVLYLLWARLQEKKSFLLVRQKLRLKIVLLSLSMVLLLGYSFPTFLGAADHLTPQNLGALHYHLYDLVTLTLPKPADEDQVQGVMEPVTAETDNPMRTGLLEGKSLIVIQAESIQAFALGRTTAGQEITPTLNALLEDDSFTFTNYFEQVGWGNSSDAEFVTHTGYYPALQSYSYEAYEDNHLRTLPKELKKSGYTTMAFHGNRPSFWNRETMYPKIGLDTFYSSEKLDMDETIGMGLSDRSLFRQAIPILSRAERPFYALLISLTSHHPYTLPKDHRGLTLPARYEGSALGDYLQTVHYLDASLGAFIKDLKRAGLYDESVIILYGDHQGLDHRDPEVDDDMSDFLGRPYLEEDMFNVPFIIHIPGMNRTEGIKTVGGQIDFYPTLRNLLGWAPESDRFIGKDLLNAEEGFVAKQVHVSRGSFINDQISFLFSPDGIFENSTARDRDTGALVPPEVGRAGYERAMGETTLSEYIMENDLVETVTEKGLPFILEMIESEEE